MLYKEQYKFFMCVHGGVKISQNAYGVIKEAKLCKSDVMEASLIRVRTLSQNSERDRFLFNE